MAELDSSGPRPELRESAAAGPGPRSRRRSPGPRPSRLARIPRLAASLVTLRVRVIVVADENEHRTGLTKTDEHVVEQRSLLNVSTAPKAKCTRMKRICVDEAVATQRAASPRQLVANRRKPHAVAGGALPSGLYGVVPVVMRRASSRRLAPPDSTIGRAPPKRADVAVPQIGTGWRERRDRRRHPHRRHRDRPGGRSPSRSP